ncbi:type III restriction/modification enzyme, mod subunit [Entomoplasma ellychniae]|uniref:Type III restriction/modification enzyme, mod subunit n=1 Tax=Entomoplasma ellychniae TaxID=2114 RepID=A0A8E2UEG9_9MOLU|nr:site-specific DNA-methyltransferase [Entomoplasma ellychniae]PPE05088.1 type III restriction/modification enzyme, mod subunit [Entomoplasma ellychniae]
MEKLNKVKLEQISLLQERVSEGSLEESNFRILKKIILKADNSQEVFALASMGMIFKNTGLVYDQKTEKIENNIKYLSKNNILSFVESGEIQHELLIGDNYDSLLNLQIKYLSKIKIIYIDPPYGSNDLGEFADTNYQNAISRDNLLSMLHPRLILARTLLLDDGVIYCSIDDKNYAYIKCLFDEVFGEENYISTFIWNNTTGGGIRSKHVNKTHEYILFYSKNKKNIEELWAPLSPSAISSYKLKDDRGKLYRLQQFAWQNESEGLNQKYPITTPDGTEIIPQEGYIYRTTKETFNKWNDNGIIVFKKTKESVFSNLDGSNTEWTISVKDYLGDGMGAPTSSLPKEYVKTNQKSSSEIKDIFGKKVFKFTKPVDLIKYLIKIIPEEENTIVLDFFAGSGTTGQAVCEINKELGKKYKFILCTNNEKDVKLHPRGIAYDVTVERLRRVMTGIATSGNSNFKWIKNNEKLGGNLEVFEIFFADNKDIDIFNKIDETNYGYKKMSLEEKIKWVCENFEKTAKVLK